MDTTDHSIPPTQPQARISKAEFLDLLDAAYNQVRCKGGVRGYIIVEGYRKANIIAAEPFKTWFDEWLKVESQDCED